MEKYIDLHTHSIKSDGSMTPSELVRHAKANGLAAVALTDHDCTDGIKEALSEGDKIGIEVVSGVELSAISDTETHILGYLIDPNEKKFKAKMAEVLIMREKRNEETAEKLRAMGFNISVEDAKRFCGGSILGRAHFACAMVEKGMIGSVKEAFDKYLGSGRPCFSGRQLLTAPECVQLINGAGGAAFCAHLHLMRKSDEELYAFLKELKKEGLAGIEGYYTEYTPQMFEKYNVMARELGLIVSGGTDFHGKNKPHISIGVGYGNLRIPYSVLDGIKEYKRKRENI